MADRNKMYAKLRILATQGGLIDGADDTAYRDWMQKHTGKRSAKELTQPQLLRLIDALAGKKVPAPDREALVRKLEAQLAAAGRTLDYLEGGTEPMVKRICKVDRVAFCTPPMLGQLIAALAYDAGRHGRRV